jgi:hypothetical protein
VGITAHLRGVVIAGGLAALALALGFVTLLMNQSASQASVHPVLSLKARHLKTPAKTTTVHVVKRIDPNLTAALHGGLPRSVARALAARPVVVVELSSPQDSVAQLALGEAKAGAKLGGASFVVVDVDKNGGAVQVLTRLIGQLPMAPAALVYARPATLYVTLPGFNDRTTVQQAVANAAPVTTVGHVLVATPTWASRAVVLCRRTYTQFGAMGGLGNPGKLAVQKTRFEAVAAGFLSQMKALKPAAGTAVQVKQLNVLLVKNFAAEDAIVAATTLHNAGALASAKARAAGYQLRIDKLERKLGAAGCVEAAA